MALLITPIYGKPDDWRKLFAAEMPELELRFWPDVGNPAEIEAAAVAASMPHGTLKTFPNLRLIVSLLAGAEALLADPELPDVPIVRAGLARRRPDDERGDAAARAAPSSASAGVRAGAAALRVDFAAAAARAGTQGRRHGAGQHRARRRQGARPARLSGRRLGELAARRSTASRCSPGASSSRPSCSAARSW